MGWASGFRAGSDVARQAIDTYRQAALQRDIEAAQGISAQEVKAPGATQAQVDAANAETAGLAAQDARDFGLEQPLQYNQAQVGQATAPSRFKLGNQMMDTAPTEQQVAGVRRKAMVDAMTRFDPVQGMRMGMELERDDREKTRFGNEQADRDSAKALEKSRRDYYNSLVNEKDGNKLAESLGGVFSADGSGVDAMLTFDPQANKFLFASRIPGMPSRQLDRAELVNLAMGVWEQGNGDFNRGMQMVLDGVREKRKLQEADRTDGARIAEGNAGLYWKGRNFQLDADYKLGSLANDRERVGIARATAGRTGQNIREFVDAKGNTVLLDLGSLAQNKDGSLAVPQGLRPKSARPEVTTANVLDYARALVESQTPDPDAPGRPLTMNKALAVAREQLNGGEYKSAADRLVDAYLANRAKPAVQPTPAAATGVRQPNRQIGTIVPPRSGADLAPRKAATDEDIIKMLAR